MHLSLKVKLLLLVGLSSLPLLLAQLWVADTWRKEQLKQASERLITHNALAAEHLRMLQEQAKQGLELIAQMSWPSEDRAACTQKAQRILASLPKMYANVLVMDLNGQVLCNARAPERLHNLADRDYVQKALQRGATGIGGLIIGRTTGTPAIGLATPHRDMQGVMDLLLGTSIELGEVTRDLDARLPKDVLWWMLDEHATVMASNDPRSKVAHALPEAELIQTLWTQPPPTAFLYRTSRGEEWLISQLVVGESALGDRLLLAQPVKAILAEVNQPLYLAATSSLVALLIALLAAWGTSPCVSGKSGLNRFWLPCIGSSMGTFLYALVRRQKAVMNSIVLLRPLITWPRPCKPNKSGSAINKQPWSTRRSMTRSPACPTV